MFIFGKNISSKLILSFLSIFVLQACDIYTDEGGEIDLPPQTVILDVKRTPNPVAPGDTALFTCIIKDSLDERFKFYWRINKGVALDGELVDNDPPVYLTENKNQRWKSPFSPGNYKFTVYVNNGSEDSVSVFETFSISVE